MNVSRRFFLAGAGALGAFSGCRMMPSFGCFGKPRVKFGVVSDVHVRIGEDALTPMKSHDTTTLEHTFTWFRDQGVDAVMIAGDMADLGLVKELEAVAKTWWKVFPNDKAPDGRTVTRLFVTGNHDWEGFTYSSAYIKKIFSKLSADELKKEYLRTNYKANWERIWKEEFKPVWMKEVKGYKFVGAHWVADRCRGAEERGIVGVEEFFAQHAKEFDPCQPFFYFQHPHPKNTVCGPKQWGQDDGRSARALTPFSNAIAFSGHSHTPLTDEQDIWQGAFTSIGTASLRYSGPYDARQGMLVSVCNDHVRIERREFIRDNSLGDDWVIPLPAAEAKPFAFQTRAKVLGAPAFAEGAQVSLVCDRAALVPEKPKPNQKQTKGLFKLKFPTATAAKARANRYDIQMVNRVGQVIREELGLRAPDYAYEPTHKLRTTPVEKKIAFSAVPAGTTEVGFLVTPVSAHGERGVPLATPFVKL